MGFFDLFKKNVNPNYIHLQNALMNVNYDKLVISERDLIFQANMYVETHSKIINESIELIYNTNNIDVFVSRYNLAIERLKLLEKIENYYPFKIKPSFQLNGLITGKEILFDFIIDKTAKNLLTKISNLKTDKAKNNNIEKYFSLMYSYANEFSDANIRYLEYLKQRDLIKDSISHKRILDFKKTCELTCTKFYIWKTCKDQRVRNSHKYMDDVIVFFDDLVSPEKLVNEDFIGYYYPGERYDCRCYASIIDVEFINWPHKVLYNETIQTMTREQFEEII
ncbi:structural protein [Clostridium neonatale]|uniref:hypothetical protein n=1 Tax=Clostridium neonatale TaxID=137838 RepID=UPI00291BBC5C|nr:putative phage-like protein [Clostridium neonatale]